MRCPICNYSFILIYKIKEENIVKIICLNCDKVSKIPLTEFENQEMIEKLSDGEEHIQVRNEKEVETITNMYKSAMDFKKKWFGRGWKKKE